MTTLKDNSHVNPGCLPIATVYWRVIDMDTGNDILSTISGDPAADITGAHVMFTGGTYLEPEINFDYFNGITTEIKIVKIIKDSCSKISPPAELVVKADDISGEFDIDCAGGTAISFANHVETFTEAYSDNTVITLANIPVSASAVTVTKNFSLKLILNQDYTVSGNNVTILTGSDEPTVMDPDVFDINYAYNP